MIVLKRGQRMQTAKPPAGFRRAADVLNTPGGTCKQVRRGEITQSSGVVQSMTIIGAVRRCAAREAGRNAQDVKPGGESAMRRGAYAGLCALMLCCATGCQCCFLFEPYAQAVDEVATCPCNLDCLYIPALDLTRIGRRDWCECPVNRLMCGCRCNRMKPAPCSTGYDRYDYRTLNRSQEPTDAPPRAAEPTPAAAKEESPLPVPPSPRPPEPMPAPLP